MKSNFLKALLIIAILGNGVNGSSQALIAKGYVKSNTNEATEAYYTLYNSYELLKVGKCSELNLQLGYNDCYTLTFSKPGYQSKIIVISTFDNTRSRRTATFTVALRPLKIKDVPEPDVLAGRFYFDKEISDYRCISYSEKSGMEAEKELNKRVVSR